MTTATMIVLQTLLVHPTKAYYGLELLRDTGLPSGKLYVILARLEQAGWVEKDFEDLDTTGDLDRPRRRTYRLSSQGLARARNYLAVLGRRRQRIWPQPGISMS